jgi:peroxiredoxin
MKKILAAVALGAAAIIAAPLLAAPAFAALTEGASAPDISAIGMTGGKQFTFKLSDALKKGPVVIYFFPAAYTAGCTEETKRFADAADEFKANGATLIGLTSAARMADGSMAGAKESLARLAEFSAEHCRDKFPIAAVDASVADAYNVKMAPRANAAASSVSYTDRTSYVITPDSKVALAFTAMAPGEHITKTLDAVKAWKAKHPG